MFESVPLTTAGVAEFLERLPSLDVAVPDAERIDQLALLESIKGACAAAQARASVAFEASQVAAREAEGVPAMERRRGVGAQVALARRESPHKGSQHLGFAKAMVNEMPHTMEHLAAGRTSEWRATIMCRETACLPVESRAEVDRRLAADLPTMSDRQVERAARALAAELDPASVALRASKAAGDRCVTLRPAPDAMTYLTALLPVAQGVAAYAALHRDALTSAAAGDVRSKGQVMADTLVERVTGQACADAVPVQVNLVMPFDTMAGWSDEPAEAVGCGAVSAETARAVLAASAQNQAAIWFRRLFTSPDSSQLVALDSRARLFPAGLRRFVTLRDKTCTTHGVMRGSATTTTSSRRARAARRVPRTDAARARPATRPRKSSGGGPRSPVTGSHPGPRSACGCGPPPATSTSPQHRHCSRRVGRSRRAAPAGSSWSSRSGPTRRDGGLVPGLCGARGTRRVDR